MKNRYSTGEQLNYALKRAKGIPIHINLQNYFNFAEKVKSIKITSASKKVIEKYMSNGSLTEKFAAINKAVDLALGIQPYSEQIIAGKIMLEKNLVQMETGEGKTIAAVFPAVINAADGAGTAIFTANEYLAKRDAMWMGAVYSILGINCAYVDEKMTLEEKRTAYSADVVYLTAKQAGFDYLNDCIQYNKKLKINMRFENCIVDEADFILIDEARIPLVIAREKDGLLAGHILYESLVHKLEDGTDFQLNRTGRKCTLTSNGINHICNLLDVDEITPEGQDAIAGVNVALHAEKLLARNIDYIVRRDKIELVDELTGRVAEKREWPFGIQRALEAKEGLSINNNGEICGSITIENFVRLYPKISGMTATAESAALEFYKKYGMQTFIIPEHMQKIRKDNPDLIYKTKAAKYTEFVKKVKQYNIVGRPVLIGTASVYESEHVSELLLAEGIKHNVLNAVNDAEEAVIIANAGMPGAVTVSTNMAGRGTDILLGGPKRVDEDFVRNLGGLIVLSLNRHESRRIDNQLRGRAGRQGDPGESLFLLSLEDRLFQRYGIAEFIPEKILQFSDDKPLTDHRAGRELERAQEIIENQHSKMRETLHNYSHAVEVMRKNLLKDREDALFSHIFPQEILDQLENIAEPGEYAEKLAKVYAFYLDEFWTEFLDWIEILREGIHLRRLGKKEPLIEYIRDAQVYYSEGFNKAVEKTVFHIKQSGLDAAFSEAEKRRNGSTWTYLIDDNPFPSFSLSLFGMDNAVASVAGLVLVFFAPVFLVRWLTEKFSYYIKKS